MRSLAAEIEDDVRATSVKVTDATITVDLEDGRSISVPTEWYPRLANARPSERANYEIDSVGVTWPDIEADFSIRGVVQVLARRSQEGTQGNFRRLPQVSAQAREQTEVSVTSRDSGAY
jgi:hypothetical protein